ncbi:hypothetical protein A2U01_0051555, partial [Trifolium medium]|nr:hypothetical protein [Trifolium medium]
VELDSTPNSKMLSESPPRSVGVTCYQVSDQATHQVRAIITLQAGFVD